MSVRRVYALCGALLSAVVLTAACSGSAPAPITISNEAPVAGESSAASPMTGIVVLGDSLTAGLGLVEEEAFPARLQARFVDEGYHEVDVINAGISGDTTAGGLRRVEALLTPDVRIAVVALGANDALRGLSVADTRRNLEGIIDDFLDHGVSVVLAGMEAPTNLGEDYRTAFRNVYRELADQYGGRVRLVPFLLAGVAGVPALNQADGIHPNAEGADLVAELLYPTLRDLVDQIPQGPVTQ